MPHWRPSSPRSKETLAGSIRRSSIFWFIRWRCFPITFPPIWPGKDRLCCFSWRSGDDGLRVRRLQGGCWQVLVPYGSICCTDKMDSSRQRWLVLCCAWEFVDLHGLGWGGFIVYQATVADRAGSGVADDAQWLGDIAGRVDAGSDQWDCRDGAGGRVLEGWWHSFRLARLYLEQDGMGSQYWLHMPTVFAQMRLWGCSVSQAYVIHGISAGAAVVALGMLWRRSTDVSVRWVATTLVSLMVSPYLMDYDLLWLVWALVIIQEKWSADWSPVQQGWWLMMWLVPALDGWWAGLIGFHWTPWVLWGQLMLLWFRTGKRAI